MPKCDIPPDSQESTLDPQVFRQVGHAQSGLVVCLAALGLSAENAVVRLRFVCSFSR